MKRVFDSWMELSATYVPSNCGSVVGCGTLRSMWEVDRVAAHFPALAELIELDALYL